MAPYSDPGAPGRANRQVLALSLVGLFLFLAWQALVVRSYVRSEIRPPSWEGAGHLQIALDYREARGAGLFSRVPRLGHPPYPPLYHLALTRAYEGSHPARATLWLNWGYMALLCLALFAIAWEFSADATSLAAVVVFACSPAAQGLMLAPSIDLAVVALAAAAYWALLRSDEFKNWPGTLAFGALFAAGMLHHWNFLTYMIPAYYLGLKALTERQARWKALAAGGLALAGFGPWYFQQAPRLVWHLIEVMGVWEKSAWRWMRLLSYLFETADGLGPLFWAMGWIGLTVPYYRRNWEKGWLIPAWVMTSYLLWVLVPYREARYLLPGLPGLVVAACGSWPAPMIWGLAAFQLLGGINHAAGWISPIRIPFPFQPAHLFLNRPPAKENWPAAELLREAQKRRQPGSPAARMTVVADAPHFNVPSLAWEARRLGLADLHPRAADRRLCEFSEFVAVKDARTGAGAGLADLNQAVRLTQEPGGWFSRAYEKAGQWPLPDGSKALLYQRRRLAAAPFKSQGGQFQFYTTDAFAASDFKVELGSWSPSAAAYPLAKAAASAVEIAGVKVSRPAVEFSGLALLPAGRDTRAAEWDEVRFLKLDRLRVLRASMESEDLRGLLESRVRGLRLDKLELDAGAVRLTGTLRSAAFFIEAALALSQAPPGLRVEIRQARLGLTPLPASLLKRYQSFFIPFQAGEPYSPFPFSLELAGLTLKSGRLLVP